MKLMRSLQFDILFTVLLSLQFDMKQFHFLQARERTPWIRANVLDKKKYSEHDSVASKQSYRHMILWRVERSCVSEFNKIELRQWFIFWHRYLSHFLCFAEPFFVFKRCSCVDFGSNERTFSADLFGHFKFECEKWTQYSLAVLVKREIER
jgi:hypothetical protein